MQESRATQRNLILKLKKKKVGCVCLVVPQYPTDAMVIFCFVFVEKVPLAGHENQIGLELAAIQQLMPFSS